MSYLLEQALVKLEGWEDIVTIVSSDMRYWNAPEKADILVNSYAHFVNCLIFVVYAVVSDCCWFEFRLVNC
jgi:hypothetical protein